MPHRPVFAAGQPDPLSNAPARGGSRDKTGTSRPASAACPGVGWPRTPTGAKANPSATRSHLNCRWERANTRAAISGKAAGLLDSVDLEKDAYTFGTGS